MFRKFIKDTTVYGLTGLLTKGITIFFVPIYTRIFSPTDYGIIDVLSIISSIISIIVPFQISQGIARFYGDAKEKSLEKIFSSTALIFTFTMYSVFLVSGLTFSRYFTMLLIEDIEHIDVFRLWVFSAFIAGIFYSLQNQLKWMLKPSKYALVSLVYSLITVFTTILFVIFLRMGLQGVFLAQIIGGIAASILSFCFSKEGYMFRFSKKKLFEMLAYSIPLIPSGIGLFFFNYIHRIMIKSMMSLADLGLFAVGTRIASAVTLVMQGFQGSLTPLIFTHYKLEDTPGQIAKIFRYFVFGALIMAAFLSIFAKEILIVLTAPAYYSAFIIGPFLVFDRFLSSGHIFTPGLYLAKRTKTIAIINITGAIINFVVSYLLIKHIGILGAAIGTLSSTILVFMLNMYYSQRLYKIPFNFKPLTISTCLTLTIIAVSLSVNIDAFSKRILFKSALFLFNIFVLFLFKVMTFKEFMLNISKVKTIYKEHNGRRI